MPPIQSCRPGAGTRTDRPAHEGRKAMLTCPRCSHASPPDGDWVWTDCQRGREICCPDCERVLTVRPAFVDSDTPK